MEERNRNEKRQVTYEEKEWYKEQREKENNFK